MAPRRPPNITHATLRSPSDVRIVQLLLLNYTILDEDVVRLIMKEAKMIATDTSTSTTPKDIVIHERNSGCVVCRTALIQPRKRFLGNKDGTVLVREILHPVEEVVVEIKSHDQGFCDNPDAGAWTWFTLNATRPGGAFELSELELVRNQAGVVEYQDHTANVSRSSGSEKARRFVEGLQAGDVIEVRAHACFSGWVNYTKRVQISLLTADGY